MAQAERARPAMTSTLYTSSGDAPNQKTGAPMSPCTVMCSENASARASGWKMLASNRCNGARGAWCATHATIHSFSMASALS